MNESPTLRDEMLELLRPFTIGITKVLFLSSLCDRRDLHLISRILSLACLPHMFVSKGNTLDSNNFFPGQRTGEVIYYSRKLMMLCPNVSSASILLYYLFKEASFVPQVPSHVPQTRSIAVSTQRSGPTMEDCSRMAKYRTPTVADQQLLFLSSVNMADTSMSRSMMHNDDFSRAVLEPSTGVFATGYPYAPGILSGLWEEDDPWCVSFRLFPR